MGKIKDFFNLLGEGFEKITKKIVEFSELKGVSGFLEGIRGVIRKINKGSNILIAGTAFAGFGMVLVYFNLYATFGVRLFFWLLVMGKTYVYLEQNEYNWDNGQAMERRASIASNKLIALVLFIMAVVIAFV